MPSRSCSTERLAGRSVAVAGDSGSAARRNGVDDKRRRIDEQCRRYSRHPVAVHVHHRQIEQNNARIVHQIQ